MSYFQKYCLIPASLIFFVAFGIHNAQDLRYDTLNYVDQNVTTKSKFSLSREFVKVPFIVLRLARSISTGKSDNVEMASP